MNSAARTDPRVIACRLLLLDLVPDDLAARVLHEDVKALDPAEGAKVLDYVVGTAVGFMLGSVGHAGAVQAVREQLAAYVNEAA